MKIYNTVGNYNKWGKLTKQALVPRSFRHCASNDNNFPGKTLGSASSSCGAL